MATACRCSHFGWLQVHATLKFRAFMSFPLMLMAKLTALQPLGSHSLGKGNLICWVENDVQMGLLQQQVFANCSRSGQHCVGSKSHAHEVCYPLISCVQWFGFYWGRNGAAFLLVGLVPQMRLQSCHRVAIEAGML